MGKYDMLMSYEEKEDKYADLMSFDDGEDIEAPAPQASPGLGQQLIGRGKNFIDAVNPTKPIYGMKDYGMNAPLRAVRAAGQAGGAINDVIGAGIGLGAKLIPQPIKDKVSGAVRAIGDMEVNLPPIGQSDMPPMPFGQQPDIQAEAPMRAKIGDIVGSGMQDIGKLKDAVPQSVQDFAGDALNASDLIGVAGAAKGIMKIGGEALEQAGKGGLRSAVKITNKTAYRAGKNVDEGVENIINNIAKYQVQSTGGGIKGIAQNARGKIDDLMEQSDNLIREFGQRNPGARVDVESTLLQLMDDVQNGNVPGMVVEADNAQNIVAKIYDGLERAGLAGQQPVEKIPEIKKFLRQEFDIFKKGPMHTSEEVFKSQVADEVYFRMKNQLDNFVPGMRENGTQLRELIDVENAMLEASKRSKNNNPISLTDWIILSRSGTGAEIPFVVGKKLVGYGRGPSALISAGRGAQSLSRANPAPPAAASLLLLPGPKSDKESQGRR